MRVLLLVAGTNNPSNAGVLAEAFCRGMQQEGDVTCELLRVEELELEHFTLAHYDPRTKQGLGYDRLKKEMDDADGVVIATPIWNFSIPAHLKNLIDRMGTFALDAETRSKGLLKNKPFYFLFTGGAPVPAWKGLMRLTTLHLPESIRYFGGTPMGKHYEGKAMLGRGRFGVVLDQRPQALKKTEKKGRGFVKHVRRYAKDGSIPLWNRLFLRAYRFGQKIMAKL